MNRNFLIDTDTASDDAVALIMALRDPGITVRAITAVAGNVPLGQGLKNALYVTELCDAAVPVYAGCDRPLSRPAEDATWFHGRDGLGDKNYPPPLRSAAPGHAVDAIIRTIHDHPGLTLVTLGPLTNIATALMRDPSIVSKVDRCVIMGGNPCCVGNVTPAAEYNIWCDPEAAQIVVSSGLPIELVGWHLCRGEANLLRPDIDRIRAINTPLAKFAIDCNAVAMEANRVQSGEIGIALPDPTAMAVAINPSICTSVSSHTLAIECQSDLSRGQTIVDQLNVSADERNRSIWQPLVRDAKPAKIVWTIDIARWKQLLFDCLASVTSGPGVNRA